MVNLAFLCRETIRGEFLEKNWKVAFFTYSPTGNLDTSLACGKRSCANAMRALWGTSCAYDTNDGGAMNDANRSKARRLMTMAGLLIVDLAGERVALRKLVEDARQAVHYGNNQQLREGEHDRPARTTD